MNYLDFNAFACPYIFISTKYYCNRGLTYFENSDTSFELSRYILTNKDYTGNTYFDYEMKSLVPSNVEGGGDSNFRLMHIPEKKILLTIEQGIIIEDSILADLESNEEYINIVLTNGGAFITGELQQCGVGIYKVKYTYKNNEAVTDDNSINCESRVFLSDTNIEPAFDSEGYILPVSNLVSPI